MFEVDGYYLEDGTEFYGELVCEYDGIIEGWEDKEDEVILFGVDERVLDELKNPDNGGVLGIVVKDYRRLQ